ncbi:MAG: hypothetical protein ACTH2H_07430 [Glutamicibacter sp.]|nr:hypothetical protein [Glutamicibacter sp. BW80]
MHASLRPAHVGQLAAANHRGKPVFGFGKVMILAGLDAFGWTVSRESLCP